MNYIIVGMPHSYTSAVAEHFLNRGMRLSSKKESNFDYDTYEPDYEAEKDFEIPKLAKEINENDNCVYKLPTLGLYLDQLIPLLKPNEYRLFFVIRNPIDIISSTLEKSKKYSANYHLLKLGHMWELAIKYNAIFIIGEYYVDKRKTRKLNWKLQRRVLKIWEKLWSR